jgi:MoxR-like ATPase
MPTLSGVTERSLAVPLDEAAVAALAGRDPEPLQVIATPDEILNARAEISGLYMDDKIADYIVDLVQATRDPVAYGLAELEPLIDYGASPRATIYLATCARAEAFLRGRGYVLPEDVKAIGGDVLRHRIITSFEAEAEEFTSDDVLARVFEAVEVP